MNTFTGETALRAHFDGEALVLRDEETKGVVMVEAQYIIDYLAWLQQVVFDADAS